MKKRVLIFGMHFYPDFIGIGKYNTEMVQSLSSRGYDCTVITGYPFYPFWKVQPPYKGLFFKKEKLEGLGTIYRCPLYVPANPTGAKRILHDVSFLLSSFFVVLRLIFKNKFDLVVTVSPPFHLGISALFYRFFKRTKVLYHIQDLQVDAARNLNLIKSESLLSLLEGVERFVLKRADYISTISPGMIRKTQLKVNREILYFPNWVDTSRFYPIENSLAKEEWGFKKTDVIILYSGNIGEKQGLEMILELARDLEAYKDVKIVICGTGAYKDRLVKKKEELQLTNVSFFPLQAPEVFNKFLNLANIHLVLQKKDASDLVMPSKLSTILAVGGLTVATASPETSLYEVLSKNNLGIVVEPENFEALTSVVRSEVANPDQSRILRQNARRYASRVLSQEAVFDSFEQNFLM